MSETVSIPLTVIERDPSDEEVIAELEALNVIIKRRAKQADSRELYEAYYHIVDAVGALKAAS